MVENVSSLNIIVKIENLMQSFFPKVINLKWHILKVEIVYWGGKRKVKAKGE